jgi:serine/threonine protein kinase
MTTAIKLLNAGFCLKTDAPGGPQTDVVSTTPREVPPGTHCGAESPLVHGLAERAEVKGRLTLPGYQILRELGRGGMAVVYKARDLRRQRIVAIKVCGPRLAVEDDVAARFHREQLLSVRLKHPNLIASFDAGEVAGVPYLVMEFVKGHNLSWLIQQQGPFPVAAACEVVRQAALGLQHVHDQQVVHRDVKPANLMLTPSGHVKLFDLGLARHLNMPASEAPTMSQGCCLGTFDYIAPEQCLDSHAVDSRADIYALGCTMYQLLSGQPPFASPRHRSVFLKMKAHVEAPVPPIRGSRPDVPKRLAAVLCRMLAKDRSRRFASAAEVAAALQPFAAGAALEDLWQAFSPSAIVAA